MRINVIIIVAGYFALLLTWGTFNFAKRLRSRSLSTSEAQYVGSRNFGTLPLLATLIAAYASNYTLLAAAESGFTGGMSGPIWYSFGVAAPLILFVWPINLVSRIRSANPHGVTMIQYIGTRYDEKTRLLGLIAVLAANIVYVISIVLAVGIVVHTLTDIPLTYTVIGGGILLLIYTSLGGYSGLVWGHVYQVILAYLAIIIALLLTLITAGSDGLNFSFISHLGRGSSDLFGWGPVNILDFLVGLLAFAIAMPQIWQRIFSAKNDVSIRRAMWLFPLFWTPIAVGSGFMGIAASKLLPKIDPGQASTRLVMDVFPTWAAIIFMLGALALVMSTGDATLNNISSNIQVDVIDRYSKRERGRRANVLIASVSQTAIGIIGIIAATGFSSVLDLLDIQYGVSLALLFPLYFGLTSNRITSAGAFSALIVALVIQVIAISLGTPPILNLITILASYFVIVIASTASKSRNSAERERIVELNE